MVMVMMLKNMVVSMRQKYAYGTINMLVTVVTRASRDFGWASPREDERIRAIRCSNGGTETHQGSMCEEEAGNDCRAHASHHGDEATSRDVYGEM